MMRVVKATLITEPDARPILQAWLDSSRSLLDYVSSNNGCGCCVDIYHLTGPADVIASRPAELCTGTSSWDDSPLSIETFEEHRQLEGERQRDAAENEGTTRRMDEAHEAFRAKKYTRYIEIVEKLDMPLTTLETKRLSIAWRLLS